jgi:hypothetical protein
MDAGTQSALLIVWALFWMLTLSLMMVHPMFRTTRIQLRRSLRLYLNRKRVAQSRLRARMLLFRGHLFVGLSRAILWLERCLQKETSPPLWIRLSVRLSIRSAFFYLFFHLLLRQSMNWQDVLIGLLVWETLDTIERAWKRRKQRRQGIPSTGDASRIKPTQEQRAEP